MKTQNDLRQLNTSLINTYDFNPFHIFDLMADSEGFITGESLNDFMNGENIELTV